MISNQILQNTLDGLKNITHTEMGIFDLEGKLLASTFAAAEKMEKAVSEFAASKADSQVSGGYQYLKIMDDRRAEYILVIGGEGEETRMIARLAMFQIQTLLVAYKERYDKDNFIKNLLLDNLLLVDIYNRAKKLNIDTSAKRVVYIVESEKANSNIEDVVAGLFADNEKDFVAAVDERDTIVVKEVEAGTTAEQLNKTAKNILDALKAAKIDDVKVSYGTMIGELREVSKSYKEAKMALEVGKIFYEDHEIIGYSKLGIGRLIYQLPLPLCKMFIRETLDGKNPEDFDEETLSTVNSFFKNNLNVSETSRQLYIHRNTLVYRIDKLQKMTGMDLRTFDDAITFKIALMVGKYMKHLEKQDF